MELLKNYQWTTKVVHKQRGKPGEMGKAVAIPPDKEAEKKEMFKVDFV